MYRIVESLYCTPGANVTLYVNYIGIKKTQNKILGGMRKGEEECLMPLLLLEAILDAVILNGVQPSFNPPSPITEEGGQHSGFYPAFLLKWLRLLTNSLGIIT